MPERPEASNFTSWYPAFCSPWISVATSWPRMFRWSAEQLMCEAGRSEVWLKGLGSSDRKHIRMLLRHRSFLYYMRWQIEQFHPISVCCSYISHSVAAVVESGGKRIHTKRVLLRKTLENDNDGSELSQIAESWISSELSNPATAIINSRNLTRRSFVADRDGMSVDMPINDREFFSYRQAFSFCPLPFPRKKSKMRVRFICLARPYGVFCPTSPAEWVRTSGYQSLSPRIQ